MTKNVGLTCSWDFQGNFFDSTKFNQKTISWTKDSFVIKKYNNEMDMNIYFYISIQSPGKFAIKIKVNTKYDINNFKIHLMLNNNYKSWISGIHENSFPTIKTWLIIGTPLKSPSFIGAYTLNNTCKDTLLPVIFSFENMQHYIENTSLDINARLLSAKFESNIFQSYEFNGIITFFNKIDDFNNFMLIKRNDFLNIPN